MAARTALLLGVATLLAGCTVPLPGVSPGGETGEPQRPCQKTIPRFAGEPVSINTWAFTATDEITVGVQATMQEVVLEHVLLDRDRDGTYDVTAPATGAYGETLSPGLGTTLTVPVDGFSAGDCAAVDVALNVTVPGSGTTLAAGLGSLQDRVP